MTELNKGDESGAFGPLDLTEGRLDRVLRILRRVLPERGEDELKELTLEVYTAGVPSMAHCDFWMDRAMWCSQCEHLELLP